MSTERIKVEQKVCWDKASEGAQANYRYTPEQTLNHIDLPYSCINCVDLHCKEHQEDMEIYTMSVLEAIEQAGKLCLPSTGGSSSSGKKDILPGWNEYAKSYAEESKFWHSLWLSQGRPTWGSVFENMRLSRRQYKYAVRRLKRCNDRIQNKKLISGLINNRRNIFEEVRKFRGNNTVISSRIDEEVGAGNIAELFAAKYKGRYNNVLNGSKLDYIRQEVTENVDKEHECILGKVNENLISQAIKKLKANKRDALFDTISDCYINGPSNLKTHIKNLVRIWISPKLYSGLHTDSTY